MTSYQRQLTTKTSSTHDLVDVTDELEEVVARSGIANGRVTVFARDESCSLVVNERETGLLSDIKKTIERIKATDGSASRSMIGSPSAVIPVVEGRLHLGTWQRVLLIELGDASDRAVDVHVIGER